MKTARDFFQHLSITNLSVVALRERGLDYWRERVYTYILGSVVVLGFFALVPSIILSISSKFYFLAVFDLVAYLYALLLLFLSKLSYRFRASQILVLGLSVGVAVFIVTGDEGAGLFWLFMVPPMASLLFGLRSGSWFLGFNVALCVLIGYLVAVESHLLHMLHEFSLPNWIVYAANFLVTDALITIPLGVLLEGLFQGAQREKEIHEDYRLLFEANPLPMWVYEESSLRFLAVNEAAILHYGYSLDEFLKMTIADIRPPEELARLKENIATSTSQARQSSGPWKHRIKNGELIDVDIFSYGIKFMDQDARLVLANDVTESMKVNQRLKESDQILQRVQSLVLVMDAQGKIRYASPSAEAMIGYSPAELMNDGWWRVSRKNERMAEIEKSELRKLISGELPLPATPYEREIVTKDGRTRWIEWQDTLGPDNTLIGVGNDVTERKLATEKIRKQVGQLQALAEIDRAILSSFDLATNIKAIVDRVITHLEVDAANVMLFNSTFLTLKSFYGRGFLLPSLEGQEVRLGAGNAGKAALQQKLVYVPRLHEQRDNPLLADAIKGEKFVCYYGFPLIARGQTKGVLEVFQRRPFEGDTDWLNMLTAFAGQTAIAIDTITAFDNLQRSNSDMVLAYNATIEGWSRALDLRDQETEGHTQRVTELAERLALRMNLDGKALADLRRGGLLHDIGKMGIPDRILRKPGKLTDEEWQIMRTHPALALDLLEPIMYLRGALPIPFAHHEKWDGSGYPRGLKAEEIPLPARIFAVVDVYDALTSDRPYRKAWTKEKTIEYIRQQSGHHFDPNVVDNFLQIV